MIVPPAPGVFSAAGLLFSDVEHEAARTTFLRGEALSPAVLERDFARPRGGRRAPRWRDDGHARRRAVARGRDALLRPGLRAARAGAGGAVDVARLVAGFHAEHAAHVRPRRRVRPGRRRQPARASGACRSSGAARSTRSSRRGDGPLPAGLLRPRAPASSTRRWSRRADLAGDVAARAAARRRVRRDLRRPAGLPGHARRARQHRDPGRGAWLTATSTRSPSR